jgi:hypothetical protein
MPSDIVGFIRFGHVFPEESEHGRDSGRTKPHRLYDRGLGGLARHKAPYRSPHEREAGHTVRKETAFRSPQEKLSKHRV